jgi:hypothetical protein
VVVVVEERERERRSEEEEEELNSSSSKFVLLFPSFSGLWKSAPEIFYFFLLQGPLRVCVSVSVCTYVRLCLFSFADALQWGKEKQDTHTHTEEKNLFSPPFWPPKRKKKEEEAVGYIWSMSANETSGPPISRVDVHSVSLSDVKKVHRDNYSEKNLKFSSGFGCVHRKGSSQFKVSSEHFLFEFSLYGVFGLV